VASGTTSHEARKTVTIVFADVTGSTELGERLDPESLRRVMRRYFDEARAALEAHGGTVEKFIGDAVMAVFGIPQLHEDDALRAVRAAAEIRDRLAVLNDELERDWGVRLALRIGVNTGEVVAGDPAAGDSYATGDAVNVAARLEQAAEPGQILLGSETYGLVRDAVEAEAVEALELKGKRGPSAALRLLFVRPGAAGHARRLDVPMVGREHELALLEQAYERTVRERTCHLFTVLGAAGIGKSRLVREFVARRADGLVMQGRCLPYGEGITYWPVAEAVKQLAGIEEGQSAEAAREQIAGLMDEHAERELIASKVAAAMGVEGAGAASEETAWAVRKLFENLAARRPLVVVFDDIQWGEATFLDLVEHVVDWSRDAPMLLICLARPELLDSRPGWGGGKFNATSVLLDQLPEEECGLLVESLLEGELSTEAQERVLEWAGGNPLFVEEMLTMLLDDGVLEASDGRWTLAADRSDFAVPATIQALLATRLDRLPADERRAVERGAVEGEVFHGAAVAALADGESATAQLMSLVRKELIRPAPGSLGSEEAYRFRHLLIRDAAYAGIPKELRAELHARFADWLLRTVGGRVAEYEEIIGYHLESAYRYRAALGPVDGHAHRLAREAGERLAAAGKRAAVRGDIPASINLLERAVALLPENDPHQLGLALELPWQLGEVGDFSRARALADELLERATESGERRLELRARISMAWIGQLVGRPEGLTPWIELLVDEAIREFEAVGDELGLARAWQLSAMVANGRSRYRDEAEALERAASHAEQAQEWAIRSNVLAWLPTRLYRGPMPVSNALARCRELLERARGDPPAEAGALAAIGALEASSGHFDEARRLDALSRAIRQELGLTHALGIGYIFSGEIEWLAGDPAAEEAALRLAYELLGAQGETAFFSTAAAELAAVVAKQGRVAEAERFAREAEEAAASEDTITWVTLSWARAIMLIGRGRPAEAAAVAREGVGLADETDDLVIRARARLGLAEALAQRGALPEAAAALGEAVELAERKENVVVAAAAREQLATLG
jgi:class 3 adenylate cyclase/tetratricopeptide (TPR) repeat protein